MMDLNVFKTDDERAEAKQILPPLVDSPAWKFMLRVFDLNIETLEAELHTKDDFKTVEEVYRLQDRIADFEQYKQLPALLLGEASTTPDEEEAGVYDEH